MDGNNDGQTVHVAPSGDIRLLVDVPCKHLKRKRTSSKEPQETQTKTFVVSSTVMCLASPVWRAMFDPNGHFAEANQSHGHREVEFDGDDVDALLILLYIAHLQFARLPRSLDFHGLVNLAVSCDKYDTVQLGRPWLSRWETPLKHFADATGYEEWLFVAWTFGDCKTYESIARALVLNSPSNSSGEILNRAGKLLGHNNMPPGTIGMILCQQQMIADQ